MRRETWMASVIFIAIVLGVGMPAHGFDVHVVYMGVMVFHDADPVKIYMPTAMGHDREIYVEVGSKWTWVSDFSEGDEVYFRNYSASGMTRCGLGTTAVPNGGNAHCSDWILSAFEVQPNPSLQLAGVGLATILVPSPNVENCGFVHDAPEDVCLVSTKANGNGDINRPISEYASTRFSSAFPVELVVRSGGVATTVHTMNSDSRFAIVNLPPATGGSTGLFSDHGKHLKKLFQSSSANWDEFWAYECGDAGYPQPQCLSEISKIKIPGTAKTLLTVRAAAGSAICPFVDFP